MMTLRAVLFDLDGTLIASDTQNANAYAMALNYFGANTTASAINESIHGIHRSIFLPHLIKKFGIDCTQDELITLKQSYFSECIRDAKINHLLFDLIKLVRNSVKIALVTSASNTTVMEIDKQFKILNYFDCVVTGDDTGSHKPHPHPYQLAATRLGVRAEECLIFEDSEVGLSSGAAFGAQVMQVHNF